MIVERDGDGQQEPRLQQLNQAVTTGRGTPRAEKCLRKKCPKKSRQAVANRSRDIAPYRRIRPQELIAKSKERKLPNCNRYGEGDVSQVSRLAQRAVEQKIVEAQGEQHAEIEGEAGIEDLIAGV